MATYEGVVGTQEGHSFNDFSVRHVDPRLYLLEREIAPVAIVLQNFARGARISKTDQVKFEWNELTMLSHTTTVGTGNDTNSATVLKVVDASIFKVGDFAVYPLSGEIAGPVTAKDTGASPNTITVTTRGYVGSGTANTAGDAVWVLRGNIIESGDAAESLIQQPTSVFNYIQQLSTTWKVSEILERSITYSDINKRKTLTMIKAKEHMEEWEKLIHFGIRALVTAGGTRYFMRGLFDWITSTIETVDVGAGTRQFTQKQWDNYIKRLFQYNQSSKRKVVFASGDVLQQLSEFKYQKMDMRPEDKLMNVANWSYQSNFGQVDLFHDRLLVDDYNRGWHAIGLDLNNVRWRPYQPQVVRRGIQERKSHYIWDEIYESGTLQVMNEPTHGIFRVINS